jgi:hypothetical protein
MKKFSIRIANSKITFTLLGLGILFVLGQSQPAFGYENAVVFGPETFIRQTGAPNNEIRNFTVGNFSGEFKILVDNGQSGKNLVTSAVIRLNDSEIFGPSDFNKQVLSLSKNVVLQENNRLEVELRGKPNSQLTITILKPNPNPTINNSKADFRGSNIGDSIYFSWAPAEQAKEYVRFRSYSIGGPWTEDVRIPGSLTNSVDITPEARETTLCYRLEARNEGDNVVRSYEPICVPKYEQSSSQEFQPLSYELPGLFNRITPNNLCLFDSQFEDMTAMSLQDIRNLLVRNESFLRNIILDVDGVMIDPAQIIYDASNEFGVNGQVILATLQKEHSAVTSKVRLSREELGIIMGYDTQNPTTIRQQIRDAAAQFRQDFDKLTNGIPTFSGWLVSKTKASEDPVDVTPVSRAVALLFSYTPWVGQYWAELGGRIGIGGNGLFCAVWAKFDFPIPPKPSVLSYSNLTSNSVVLSWTKNEDPDFAYYELYRIIIVGGAPQATLLKKITNINETSFTDSGLTYNTPYWYIVRTYDQSNLFSRSDLISIVTPPPAPSVLSITGTTTNSVSLGWTLNNDPDFKEYRLYRITLSSGYPPTDLIAVVSDQMQNSFVDANLPSGVYDYYLEIYNQNNIFYTSNQVRAILTFSVPYASILVDGNISDWEGISPAIIDRIGDKVGSNSGTDIDKIYLAKDSDYLYLRIDLSDGSPNPNAFGYHINLSKNPELAVNDYYDVSLYSNGQWWDSLYYLISLNPWQSQHVYDDAAVAGNSSLEIRIEFAKIENPAILYISGLTNAGPEGFDWTPWIEARF